jgi:glycosyltransferase involved in cell wall biosynthesis
MSRTPIIAANIGALPEVVVDHQNGLLFEAGNPDDLKTKIKVLVDNPRTISEMAAAIRPVETMQQQVSELTSLYQNLLQRDQQ